MSVCGIVEENNYNGQIFVQQRKVKNLHLRKNDDG